MPPTRCTLLTGLHTGRSAIRDNKELDPVGQQQLPAESVNIAVQRPDLRIEFVGRTSR